MPALSKKQQKFMGIVRSIQKGEQPASKFSKDAQDVAKDMKKKDVKKFASTKHKGLPMKKEILGKLKELIRKELSEYTYGVGDVVKDVNPTCPHYGAEGKVKSVNPRSVVFVVMNKGKNFKPGMELEKSHDQMKKMNENILTKQLSKMINEPESSIVKFMKKSGLDEASLLDFVEKLTRNNSRLKRIHTTILKNAIKGDKKSEKSIEKTLYGESVNEMSAKSKKIINKLGKKEKEVFLTMVDMMGFDQVMADYKRDKKAFKQALKDMSESVITEKFTVKSSREYFNNLDQALNLIINQANNLKGPLAKHPIRQNLNKLKAVKTMLKRGLAPAFYSYEKERNVERSFKGVDITELKKKLQDGKFKSAVEYSLIPALDTRSYDSNDFYFLKDKKENKLRKRLLDVLFDLRNKMDSAQLESVEEGFGGELNEKDKKKFEKERLESAEVLGYELTGVKDVNENINEKKKMFPPDKMTPKQAKEYKKFIDYAKMGIEYKIDMSLFESINEDGHTDVASSKRKVMIMVDDSNKLLNKLNGMNKEDSLPSWWSDKITLSQNYLEKATNYLLNPVESVNEGKGVDKIMKMADDYSYGKIAGKTVDVMTAKLFQAAYNKAPQKAKDKVDKMNEKQLYIFMMNLWKRFGKQVRLGS